MRIRRDLIHCLILRKYFYESWGLYCQTRLPLSGHCAISEKRVFRTLSWLIFFRFSDSIPSNFEWLDTYSSKWLTTQMLLFTVVNVLCTYIMYFPCTLVNAFPSALLTNKGIEFRLTRSHRNTQRRWNVSSSCKYIQRPRKRCLFC